MAVKKKYRIPLTTEQIYEKALNRPLRGMRLESFQSTKNEYKKKEKCKT